MRVFKDSARIRQISYFTTNKLFRMRLALLPMSTNTHEFINEGLYINYNDNIEKL